LPPPLGIQQQIKLVSRPRIQRSHNITRTSVPNAAKPNLCRRNPILIRRSKKRREVTSQAHGKLAATLTWMNLNGINQPTKRLGRRKAGRWIGQRNLEGFDPAAVELGQARMEDSNRCLRPTVF
jgi:hypothetical protein